MIVPILLSIAVLAARVTLLSLYPVHVPGPPPVWSLLWWEYTPAPFVSANVVWPAATFLGGMVARKATPAIALYAR
jgi:hypothetical protein